MGAERYEFGVAVPVGVFLYGVNAGVRRGDAGGRETKRMVQVSGTGGLGPKKQTMNHKQRGEG